MTRVAIARPVAGPGQVLVRIRASGVNPLDIKIAAGQAAHARAVLPAVLGVDLAGVVDAVGPGVTAFKVGDEVYGMTGGGGVQGARSMPICWPSSHRLSRCAKPPPCR